MSKTERSKEVGELEIEQDLAFERRTWRVQRAGWVAMLVLVLATLAGAFGRGPLSRAGLASGGVELAYERLARHQSPTRLEVSLPAGAARDGRTARVWLDRRFLQGASIEGVHPEPSEVEAGADRLTYVFALSDPTAPTVVTFILRPEEMWRRRGRVGLDGGPTLAFTQFVYP